MKKALNVTIGGRVFHIEEDAYDLLNTYLTQLGQHFSTDEEKDEIISDIEAAIAEHLGEDIHDTRQAVTRQHILDVQKKLGTVGDIVGDMPESEDGIHESQTPSSRKLFRDPDDKVIAGVASGIAQYLDIDPVFLRIFFLLTTFFYGWGLALYIILWIAMPEAKTAADKLRMSGQPITIEKIESLAKEAVHTTAVAGKKVMEHSHEYASRANRVLSMPIAILRNIVAAISSVAARLWPLLAILIGALCMLGAIAATTVAGIFIFSFFFRPERFQNDFTMAELLGTHSPLLVSSTLFALVLIPTLLVFVLGLSVARRKNAFRSIVVLPLMSLWVIAAILTGSIGFGIAPNIWEITERLDHGPQITQAYDEVVSFERIALSGSHNVSITQGDTYQVSATGPQGRINDIDFAVDNGTLVITRPEFCLFCNQRAVSISITTPSVESIRLSGSLDMTIDGFTQEQISLSLAGASTASITALDSDTVDLSLSGASRAALSGTAETLTGRILGGARLDITNLVVSTTTIDASGGSMTILGTTGSLTGTVSDGARVRMTQPVDDVRMVTTDAGTVTSI